MFKKLNENNLKDADKASLKLLGHKSIFKITFIITVSVIIAVLIKKMSLSDSDSKVFQVIPIQK